MILRYLLDAHVDPALAVGLRRHNHELIVWRLGTPTTPPLDASDPDILAWCEEHGFVLITSNRSTIPGHLNDHLSRGGHVPGIFVLKPGMNVGETIENLLNAAEFSFEHEYRDQIRYLPL